MTLSETWHTDFTADTRQRLRMLADRLGEIERRLAAQEKVIGPLQRPSVAHPRF